MKNIIIACFLLLHVCVHAQINATTADTSLQIPTTVTGGPDIWQKFLEKNIHPEIPSQNGAKPGTYVITVSFMVDTTGKVYNVVIENDPGYGIAKDVLKAFKHCPLWPPATRQGQKVVYPEKQNIRYQVSEQ